jgi:hypothetical protein
LLSINLQMYILAEALLWAFTLSQRSRRVWKTQASIWPHWMSSQSSKDQPIPWERGIWHNACVFMHEVIKELLYLFSCNLTLDKFL